MSSSSYTNPIGAYTDRKTIYPEVEARALARAAKEGEEGKHKLLLQEFVSERGYTMEMFNEMCAEHDGLASVRRYFEETAEHKLASMGMQKLADPAFTKFVLGCKFGWVEPKRGDEGNNVTVNVMMQEVMASIDGHSMGLPTSEDWEMMENEALEADFDELPE